MFITPKRCAEVRFSDPSYAIGAALLVKKGNPDHIADYASVAANKNLKVAVMAGAVEIGYAKESGVGLSQLVVLPDQMSLVKAVQITAAASLLAVAAAFVAAILRLYGPAAPRWLAKATSRCFVARRRSCNCFGCSSCCPGSD
jgi:polar amino acid transport system substrate-binding protein